ncbi:ubiquinol-cytochrome C chaperone family protein [Sphingomonas qomolangmaensis]|uniref:Ubiquinol-cytochrome C chaperone n=1 Tax=Sphingomonas qomolangmaensis TaxID=2918765 RepID=A0ABY5LA54_9SPHN|nr:ubiquinol-cytochrome C chaperone family protein [Sphingomonas qomolangmaensis]UUL82619.1 ubiquinol-cytochrome C chaperone [Sphingomonas qomolangmaensis]
MGLLNRLFGRTEPREAATLYDQVVASARAEHWYLAGGVPDTVDGRFDMVAAVLAMVLLRLEQEQQEAGQLSASLAECFIDDMDGQLRQIGIGDITVGKHIGKMMGMLGGRLGAYRDGLAAGSLDAALVRNLYRGEAPAPAALAHTAESLMALRSALIGTSIDTLRAGRLP